ncbi:hypothetical protein jhhlp_004726 [Lomentospora prolificans]|uniref:Peptidase A1 domain-containing protein n=1 Tax=Lomentospora prolificans TaxID=41688 RepID=A0A2N3N8A0_9PEZI|nr:hypothetical protein jhhlp_004726 [Lomentospora prolificans]
MRRPGYLVASGALAVHALGSQPVPGVLLMQFEEKRNPNAPSLRRRAEQTVEEVITNEKQRGGYFSTCTVGTPPQDIVLLLDSGSSDTWVPAINAPICSLSFSLDPCPLGSYDPDSSRTHSEFIRNALEINYLDQSYVKGDYFRDVLGIGESELANFTIGLGLNTSLSHGVIGVGYAINEASVNTADLVYDNLPVALARSNITSTSAYSLYLNDLGSPMGSILFGGVDTEKYVGDMMKVKIKSQTLSSGEEIFDHFRIDLTSVEAESPSGTDTLTTESFPVDVILDSGTTLTSLPIDMVEQMWEEAGAEFSSVLRQPLIPCYRRDSPGKFTFGFGGPGGPKITVPMDELVLDLTTGKAPLFPDGSRYKGQEACLFGIQDFGGPPYILGGTFLRSAYVVFDLVNNEIGIAQTDFNETDSSIVAFASNGSSIPSATEAPNQGQTDTPARLVAPAYDARTGFQNSAWVPGVFGASTVLAVAVAFWAVL